MVPAGVGRYVWTVWRYLAPRWAVGHLVVAAVAVLFLRLGWWQWDHARAGNAISYGYALQRPTFAAFGIFPAHPT